MPFGQRRRNAMNEVAMQAELGRLRRRNRDLERTATMYESILPPFGHAVTVPVDRMDWQFLKWVTDNCVIVTRAEWDRVRADVTVDGSRDD